MGVSGCGAAVGAAVAVGADGEDGALSSSEQAAKSNMRVSAAANIARRAIEFGSEYEKILIGRPENPSC